MMEINADLHIHSKYAAACSDRMDIETIAVEAKKKGIQLVGTGDCLHPLWRKEIKKYAISDEIIECNNTRFLPTVEIEDRNRVHHLLIIPSLSKAEEICEVCSKFGKLDVDGRPTLCLTGQEIGEIAHEAGALFGPCHAFTPWTGMYGTYDSISDCYGDCTKHVSFLELGLSADTKSAYRVKEIRHLTFISASDAHSPWTNKLGREFTRLSVPEPTFDGVKCSILHKNGYKPVMNVGFFPQEGKYYSTACINPDCNLRYTLQEAEIYKWKCPQCRSRITKGVSDRIEELERSFNNTDPNGEKEQAPYFHTIPLAEIIMKAVGHKSIATKGVLDAYAELTEVFGNEINVLLTADEKNLSFCAQPVRNAILAFRENRIEIIPGGGGQYGTLKIPDKSENVKKHLNKKSPTEEKRKTYENDFKEDRKKDVSGGQSSLSEFQK